MIKNDEIHHKKYQDKIRRTQSIPQDENKNSSFEADPPFISHFLADSKSDRHLVFVFSHKPNRCMRVYFDGFSPNNGV